MLWDQKPMNFIMHELHLIAIQTTKPNQFVDS